MASASELDNVLETLQRAFPLLPAAEQRAFAAKLCDVVPGFADALADAVPRDEESAAQSGASRCRSILHDAPSGPILQNGDSGELAVMEMLRTVAGDLRRSPRLPRGVAIEEASVERLRPGRAVKKSMDCRLKLSLRVDGTSRVVLLAVESKRTQSISAAALRAFLNHDVAVRAEPGHDLVMTAFISWLCDVPKQNDYEGEGRLLFGTVSENIERAAIVLCNEIENSVRRVASSDRSAAAERLRGRTADYLRKRLEIVLSDRFDLAEEEALLRELIPPGTVAAVDGGHRAGVEKRTRAPSSGPPWWKKPRV